MGVLQDGIEYLSKKHEENKEARAERRRLEAEQREEERKRRLAERQEMLEKLSDRLKRQFGWDLSVADYGFDEWGDPVYRLDNGIYVTVTERNPTSYKRKPREDPLKDVREAWRTERMKDDIKAEVLREVAAERTRNLNGGNGNVAGSTAAKA